MHVFEEKQWFNQWWLLPIYLVLIIPTLWGCYKWFLLKENWGNVGPKDWEGIIAILIISPLILTILLLFRLHTIIDKRGVSYRFYPIHKNQKAIIWTDIEKCIVKKYNPLKEYGGWGYKWGWKGAKAITVKGNFGVYIVLKNGKKLLIGTQRPEEAQQIINRYFKNERV